MASVTPTYVVEPSTAGRFSPSSLTIGRSQYITFTPNTNYVLLAGDSSGRFFHYEFQRPGETVWRDGGYTGVYVAANNVYRTSITPVAGYNYKFSAKGEGKPTTVTFSKGDGASGGTNSVTVKYGQPLPTITPPTRSVHSFDGYFLNGIKYYNADGTSAKSCDFVNENGVTMTASWSPYTYKVVFYKNDTSATGSMAQQSFTYGVSQKLTTNGFSLTGHYFSGWAKSSTGNVEYSNGQSVLNLTTVNNGTVNLYAKWDGIPLYVYFDAMEGQLYDSEIVGTYVYGKKYNPMPTPTRDGAKFVNWNTESNGTGTTITTNTTVNSTGSQTLYAIWDYSPVTVTFALNLNGKTGHIPYSSKIYYSKSQYNTAPNTGLPTAICDDITYDFNGWYTAASGGTYQNPNSNYPFNGTLYAHWKNTPSTYTVSFVDQTGTNATAQRTFSRSGSNTLPTFASLKWSIPASCESFIGWIVGADGSTVLSDGATVSTDIFGAVTGGVTLIASFSAKIQTVVFDANEGVCQTNSFTYVAGGKYGWLPIPVRAGYEFLGWYTAKTGGSVVTSDTVVSNISTRTLYAHWQEEGSPPTSVKWVVWVPDN